MENMPHKTDRYLFVDSLRCIAALAVVFYHLHRGAFEGVASSATDALSSIFKFGYLGVPMFFVISGFVIASTVKASNVTLPYAGRFIVKRFVRLAPPYWLSIAIDLLFIFITVHLLHLSGQLPSLPKVIAHLFYLQDILGYGNISSIFWPLCVEIQFYVF